MTERTEVINQLLEAAGDDPVAYRRILRRSGFRAYDLLYALLRGLKAHGASLR